MASFTWSGLRGALTKDVSGLRAERAFKKARQGEPALATLASPRAAVEWLLDFKRHGREEEDAVLRVLRRQSQTDKDGPWLAVLFLGLWPTMEWTFHRVRGFAREDPAAISALWGGLAEALGKDEIWGRPRVARRLMYFVWGRARAELTANRVETRKVAHVAAHLVAGMPKRDLKPYLDEVQEAWPAFSNRSTEKPTVDAAETDAIQRVLEQGAGLSRPKADLVIRHFVQGETLAAIAKEKRETPAACRARSCRAIQDLRERGDWVRHLLVTLGRPHDMEIREEASLTEDPEGSDRCTEHWMN